jgi:hypothetical protein
MLRMAETHSKGGCSLSGANQTTKLMTGAARGDIAAIRLGLRRVAAKANHVGVKPARNRKRHTPATLPMAGCASRPRSQVASMIELHIEALQSRKSLNQSCCFIRMTDAANWTI